MFAVYATPEGPLWWRPRVIRSNEQSKRDDVPESSPEVAELLYLTLAAAGGQSLSGIAVCRHYVASISVSRIESDLAGTAATGTVVVLRSDTPGVSFYVGPAQRM